MLDQAHPTSPQPLLCLHLVPVIFLSHDLILYFVNYLLSCLYWLSILWGRSMCKPEVYSFPSPQCISSSAMGNIPDSVWLQHMVGPPHRLLDLKHSRSTGVEVGVYRTKHLLSLLIFQLWIHFHSALWGELKNTFSCLLWAFKHELNSAKKPIKYLMWKSRDTI